MWHFLFATGIENSCPTIDGGRVRHDQFESCRHYDLWKTDFDLVEDLNVKFLRYGPPINRTWLGQGKYDWEFADLSFGDIFNRNLNPIVDLCHFGLPDFLGDFQNPDFPELFAGYARDFATRFPWVQFYTPVNEMYICALFSARYGWWNEQGTTDRSFVTALKHIVKANVLAMEAILDVRSDALFIQSESSEYFHAQRPEAIGPAEIFNEERFLSLDLNYGKRVSSGIQEYLFDSGMTRGEYEFFMRMRMKQYCIMGNDYYITNEHLVSVDGSTRAAGEVFGYNEITNQYYARYHLPVMHTETNMVQGPNGDEAEQWLWKQWANVLRVRNNGVPVIGFTWYSLTDQTDWDVALREKRDKPHAVGLYDLDRKIRPVGEAYKRLISQWRTVLPVQSVCLQVPVVTPQEYGEPWAARRRLAMDSVRTRLSGPGALHAQA